MPKYAVCIYTYDYVPCDVADYIAVESYITNITAVMLRRSIINYWLEYNAGLWWLHHTPSLYSSCSCGDYTTFHH